MQDTKEKVKEHQDISIGLRVMKTRIKYLRQEIGITQKDFAEKVGVSRQTINALENGKYNPSLLVAYKITKLLNKEHIEEVFILEDEKKDEKNDI